MKHSQDKSFTILTFPFRYFDDDNNTKLTNVN
jgi:hypothetical protein